MHYPSYTCATIHLSTLYLCNLLLLQQNSSHELKSMSGIPQRNSVILRFTNGHFINWLSAFIEKGKGHHCKLGRHTSTHQNIWYSVADDPLSI